jgi:hypothetical protein
MSRHYYGTSEEWARAISRDDRLCDLSGTFGDFTAPRTRPSRQTFESAGVLLQWWSAADGAPFYAGSDGRFYRANGSSAVPI